MSAWSKAEPQAGDKLSVSQPDLVANFTAIEDAKYTATVDAKVTGAIYTPNPVVQIVNTQSGAVATGTTAIPYDDTIPQKTEGDEYMTLAITPKKTTNLLKIEVVIHLSHSVSGTFIAALFQDTTANALAASFCHESTATAQQIKFTYYVVAGTTSETTFRVRAGGPQAGTTTFNGAGGARKLGDKLVSSITIIEFYSAT